ncbi:MAG TPA: hypothetical protein DCX72_09160 [Bacteroides uniformis]|uniref:Uncharacterized protein n=1 Tax=Bacteroides uniformis TaxID=820 RepID=A0A7J5I6H5_BACUN|nr:hypothetical protein GAS34_03540 [Bacteroides uniformis]KAB3891355.1 hypothetical protein GAS04_15305 [Bacteroides uniformis]KAB3900194.1 hypothetical protein GAS12_03585 [Bacteroides uniformis]KAB3901124.1 hypothetical protein GAS03_02620 [Bacteroides uniformis]KAB3908695.1 hypothetical protein GAS32_05050 [Bacteroides uniformis]
MLLQSASKSKSILVLLPFSLFYSSKSSQRYTFSLSIRQAVATSPISSTITVESDNTNSVILVNALLIT